jgi:cephalosporin-C deacetylase-like acetyl esterase
MLQCLRLLFFSVVLAISLVALLHGAQADLAAQLKKLDATVFEAAALRERKPGGMVERDIRTRVHEAHQNEAKVFAQVKTRQDWERFRDERIKALRESLGPLPAPGGDLKVQTARSYKGQGYIREDIAFESRPGLVVTANLYRPAQPPEKMPGILLVHGFHQPKQQGELQDMGVTWARLGCMVLVPDVLGHGERRQHPFVDAKSYAGKSSPTRQDYYGRANTSLQLSLAGESLMGWMVFDTMRSVDLLLSRPGIDKERIIVLGAVAAGGDIAALTAALDPRISAVAPFNFGGPEPETVHPLPARDAELTFPYATGGHWDDTRRLRNAARDGFLPWVVVGGVAPRRVIYAHEFAWDRAHDPVFPRLEKIYSLYSAPDKLSFAHGSGTLFGKPEGTGCANIGPVHRQAMYPTLKAWFGIPVPDKDAQDRKTDKEMYCQTPEIVTALKPRPDYQLAGELGRERAQARQKRLAELKVAERREALRRDWGKLLGDVVPKGEPRVTAGPVQRLGNIAVERLTLEVEAGIVVPAILLVPGGEAGKRAPVVVGVAQQGKQEFLKERGDAIADLLKAGIAVCLPDVRGTGETRPENDHRGPPAGTYKGVQATSSGTLLANEDLMLGRALLGDRLRDLRAVLRYLKARADLDPARVALWGDSFAPVNGANVRVDVPWDADKLPAQSEPLGGLLALFGGLWEDDVRAIAINGCLVDYATLLDNPFCHVPHDAIVPLTMPAGDLGEVVAALAPRGVRLQGLVDGNNRKAPDAAVAKSMAPAVRTYQAENSAGRLTLDSKESVAVWLRTQLTN